MNFQPKPGNSSVEICDPLTNQTWTILFFDHTAALSGAELVLFNISTRLDRSRFNPVVLLASDGDLRAKLVGAGVETHVMEAAADVVHVRKGELGARSLFRFHTFARSFRYAKKVAVFIAQCDADIVHCNSLKADVIGALAVWGMRAGLWGRRELKKGRGKAPLLVWHCHDRIMPDYLPLPVVIVFRWMCRVFPDLLIANSAATLRSIRPRVRQNTRVVHNGTSPSEFGPVDRILGEAPRVGMAGRITHWKGQHIFLAAAALVLEKYPDASFQIIGTALFGEQDYESELHELVDVLGLREKVEFSGFMPDMRSALHGLDVLVHASVAGEPFGQVVVEGMVTEIPIVATDGGGIPEIVSHGHTGLLVPMNNAAAMAGAIVQLIANPREAAEMGRAGRRHALKHFDIATTVERVEQIYSELLESI